MKIKSLFCGLFLCLFFGASVFAQQNQVSIKSAQLTFIVNKATGLPYAYKHNGSVIWGADADSSIRVIVCRLSPRKYETVALKPVWVKTTGSRAEVFLQAKMDGKTAVSFYLNYTLKNSSVTITMDRVTEQQGFELIENWLPNLATVREEEGSGWLAHGIDGGETVELKNARQNTVPPHGVFGHMGYVIPMAIVGTYKVECVMEVKAFMDGTLIKIDGQNGHRRGRIGTVQTYRVHGGRAYDMNNGGPPVAGNEKTPNLLVGQMPECRLDFMSDADKSGSVNWLDGAKLLAARMPKSPSDAFGDKFIYLIAGKYKPEKVPRTTFAQSEKLIKDIAALTDFAPQIPLISGWAYDGQDTGFPSEDRVNESLGGKTGLKNLLAKGTQYNANISLNTNYDDAYKSSPQFDTTFLARRPDGKIWRSLDWAGEYSYITGFAKYMEKYGQKRVDYMVDEYKIHDAVLVDAMSWYAIRNDWDPAHPASGYKNLVDGRYKLIDAFKKRGVDVISEHLRYPFIGKLAVSADGFGGGPTVFNGEGIPFLATIYRKSAIWGTGNFNRSDPMRSLYWNCRSIQWYKNTTDRTAIIDFYYLTVLPFSKVHNRAVETYKREGYTSVIGLENGSKITADWMKGDYVIKADGVEIAGHEATYCPIDGNRIAFYARNSRELTVELPKGWNAASVIARALYLDKRENVPVKTAGNKITVSVTGGRPVIVYRDKGSEKKQVVDRVIINQR